jgi:membrane-associated phospholipid phosphatase
MAERKQYNLILFVLLLLSGFNIYAQNIDSSYKDPDNIDVKLFRVFNNSRTETLDDIIHITDVSILPVSILTPVILFTVSRINDDTYDENSAVLLTLSEITSASISQTLKAVIERPRPFSKLKNVIHTKNDEKLLDPYSFPSGHSSMAFSFATSLTLRYPDKPVLIAGLYSYAFVVSLGRIYLGNHYPSDVLAGMLIGSGSAILIYSLRPEIISLKNNIFGEKNKPDENKSEFISPLFLGTFIVSDLINNYLLNNSNNIKLNFHSSGKSNFINFNYIF